MNEKYEALIRALREALDSKNVVTPPAAKTVKTDAEKKALIAKAIDKIIVKAKAARQISEVEFDAIVKAQAAHAALHKAGMVTLKKGMYEVARLAQILSDIAYIRMATEQEAIFEGDDSDLPAALHQDLESLAESFLTMAQEEVGELIESAGNVGKNLGGTMIKLAPADLEKAAKNISTHLGKMRKAVVDFNKGMDSSISECHKILGVDEATEMGDGKPQPAGAIPAGATDPNYSFKIHKLADGDSLKVYDDGKKAPELIKAGSEMITEGEVQKRIDEGVNSGLLMILKALIGESEAEEILKRAKAGDASGSASGSASGEECDAEKAAKGKKGDASGSASGSASGEVSKAAGVGDRSQTPVVISGARPVVKVMPVTKADDGVLVTPAAAATKVDKDTVTKAFEGDTDAQLALMRSAKPAEIPQTIVHALSAGKRA